MSREINETGSLKLSLQPQSISPQARVIICLKCQHKRTPNDSGPEWQCPACGVAYNKVSTPSVSVAHKVSSASAAPGRRDVDYDGFEIETPSAISLSLQGRVGRLRYLAYLWPTILLSGLLMLMAVSPGTLHKTLTIFLVIVLGVLWMWVPLRLMALRMHDLNQSAKWLIALILLPGVFFALGKPQVGAICAASFWLAALVLIVVPGSAVDNNYGPPPGANTTLVKIGAGVILAFMALGVVGNIKMIWANKFHSPLLGAANPAREQPGLRNQTNSAIAETQGGARLAKSNLIGLWQGEHMALRVDNVGNALFFHEDGSSSVRSTGPLRVLDDSHISIGMGPHMALLNVTAPPHMEGPVLKMTVDGVELAGNK